MFLPPYCWNTFTKFDCAKMGSSNDLVSVTEETIGTKGSSCSLNCKPLLLVTVLYLSQILRFLLHSCAASDSPGVILNLIVLNLKFRSPLGIPAYSKSGLP